jgi:hypothetical protein
MEDVPPFSQRTSEIMPPSDTKIVEVANKFIMKLNDKIINVKQCEIKWCC